MSYQDQIDKLKSEMSAVTDTVDSRTVADRISLLEKNMSLVLLHAEAATERDTKAKESKRRPTPLEMLSMPHATVKKTNLTTL